MDRTRFDGCQLDIDHNRGVIWINGPDGRCLLRICNLPKPIPKEAVSGLLDITYGVGTSWGPFNKNVLLQESEEKP